MTVGTQGKQGVRERTDLFLKILKFSLDLIRLLMEAAKIAKELRTSKDRKARFLAFLFSEATL